MSDSICVRLPYLHAFQTDDLPFRYLHPGLPDLEKAAKWLPPDYPFSQADAQALARDLRGQRESALAAAAVLHNRGGIAAEAGWRQEMADLAALEGEKSAPSAVGERILREQAQKILLWIWLQEEALLDISSLENSCAAAALALAQNFLEKETGVSASRAVPDLSLLPPWRVCAANAALFLPPELPILAEGPMAADMEEYLDFSGPADWHGLAGRRVRMAKAPLWRALGQNRPGKGAPYYMAERLWLALEEA